MITHSQLIFGIPLPSRSKTDPDFQRPLALERALMEGRPGFLLYGEAAGTRRPGAFGVEGDGFGGDADYVDLRAMRMTPTLRELESFDTLWQQLDNDMQQLVGGFGLPRLFVITTTLAR